MEENSNKKVEKDAIYRTKSQNILRFRNLLMDGFIEDAIQLQIKIKLDEKDITSHVQDAFNFHMQEKNFRNALELVIKFPSLKADTYQICNEEWGKLNSEKKYEEAARWAKEQALNDGEIIQSARRAYSQFIENEKVEDAIRVMEEFNLSKTDLMAETMAAYNNAFKAEEFYQAALIGEKFNFSKNRTLLAATKACTAAIEKSNFENATKILNEFSLLSDDTIGVLAENDAKMFLRLILEKFVEPLLMEGSSDVIHDFAVITGIHQRTFNNFFLNEFLQEFFRILICVHNILLNNDRAKQAKIILENFNLFEMPLPTELMDSLLEKAEEYHGTLLKLGDLLGALSFKDDYGLFDKHVGKDGAEGAYKKVGEFVTKALEKGDIQLAQRAIEEYRLHDIIVNEAVFTAVANILKEDKYEEAFAIQKIFKLDLSKEKIYDDLVNRFSELMFRKDYNLAAEFAETFRINKVYIDEAAFKAWKREFEAQKYNVALNLKKQYKIPKKRTLSVATKVYWKFREKKDFAFAISIRRTYGIPLNIVQLIVEFVMWLFVPSPGKK